ncbi:rRNA maturation RNase YbeY [Thiohalocapsa halophila]
MSSTTQPPAAADGEPPSSLAPAPEVLLGVQRACDAPDLPGDEQLASWVSAALIAGSPEPRAKAALTLRVVGTDEGARLNEAYRGKAGPTNVLSFPFEPPSGLPREALEALGEDLDAELGDLVICAPVLRREAADQGKTLSAHTAHLIVHGTLHLIGYDHIDPAEAARMEALESAILRGLGFPTPYEVPEDPDDHRSSA